MNIRARIFICFFLIAAAAFYFLIDWIVDDLRPRYLEAMEESLADTSVLLAAFVGNRWAQTGSFEPDVLRGILRSATDRPLDIRIYDLVKTNVDVRVYLTDTNGIVLFDSENGHDEGENYSRWNDVRRTLQGSYGARSTRTDPDDPASTVLYVAAPVMANERTVGVLTVCKPTLLAHRFMLGAKRKIVLAGLLAVLAVAVVGLGTSHWITLPIRRLTDYAQKTRTGQRAPLPPLGQDEIGLLGRAMDDMRVALEGLEYVEHYIQALTHEIKGPLSAIQGALELLEESGMPEERRRRFLENARAETGRIRQIVERLLLLASLESRRELREPDLLELSALIRDTIESLTPAAEAKHIRINTRLSSSLPMRGERFLLHHAVSNLLRNALDFTPNGGQIDVEAQSRGNDIIVTISDSGPGIPDYALPRIFERFYSLARPDTGRKSSGLGLAIVKEIAELHRGSIRLENRPTGGAQATLTLPISKA